MNRVFRVFYFAVAVAFASAILAPRRVGAGPGDCEAFSAADIDTCFVDWAAAIDFDAMIDVIECSDDPRGPTINMRLERADNMFLSFTALVSGGRERVALSRSPGGCGDALRIGVAKPELHICRAEVLRSFTWRQLCAQRVDRSP